MDKTVRQNLQYTFYFHMYTFSVPRCVNRVTTEDKNTLFTSTYEILYPDYDPQLSAQTALRCSSCCFLAALKMFKKTSRKVTCEGKT